jgi:hypothetical protein
MILENQETMRNKFLPTAALLWSFFFGLPEASIRALPTAAAPGAYIAVGRTYALFQSDYGQQALGGASPYVDVNATRQLGIEAQGHWLTVRQ